MTIAELQVQRIPRYNLLLADLVRHTWKDHQVSSLPSRAKGSKDYLPLKEALEKMQGTANYINERKRESDNINKILEIQAKFTGKFEVWGI